MSLRVDKIYERRIVWDKLLADKNSEAYGQLSYEAVRAVSYEYLNYTSNIFNLNFDNVDRFRHVDDSVFG